jgi:hypothetical protein
MNRWTKFKCFLGFHEAYFDLFGPERVQKVTCVHCKMKMGKFKRIDFEVLATLPDDWEWELFHQANGEILAMATKGQEGIGYILKADKTLIPAQFK